MKQPKGIVSYVEPNSIAEELGIQKGDKIIQINGQVPEDLIDISFLFADLFLEMVVEKQSGEEWVLEIEKDYEEEIGISFEESTFDGIRRCQNKCIFCFVDQMPPNLRKTLYVKDDDYRMSFLHGNFVTFTNLKEENIERILRLRLSPLYISVHTTNEDLRQAMLSNKQAGKILSLIAKLVEADLEIHTQIVLCPGFNDGVELDKTITDLIEFWPQVQSIAVVPVGVTRFREKLTELKTFDQERARDVIHQVTFYQESYIKEFNNPVVFLADEFYLKAEMPIPSSDHYGDFPQLENGIGVTRLFLDSFYKEQTRLPKRLGSKRYVTMVTGTSAAKILSEIAIKLNEIENLNVNFEVISNKFFGETVTVAGLVTGQDIFAELCGKDLKGEVFIPSVMLRASEQIFIDGMSLHQLEAKLGINIKVIDNSQGAANLINAIIDLEV